MSDPCPRCRGPAAPPRGPTPASPFRRAPTGRLTCADCGLDYAPGTPAWQPDDRRASSVDPPEEPAAS